MNEELLINILNEIRLMNDLKVKELKISISRFANSTDICKELNKKVKEYR